MWSKFFSRSFFSTCLKLEQNAIQSSTPKPSIENSVDINSVVLRKIDKRILVWFGKYDSLKEVPDRVSRSTLQSAHSKCRIRVANLMMVGIVFGCIYTIMMGKKEAKETLINNEMKMRQDYNAKMEKKLSEGNK